MTRIEIESALQEINELVLEGKLMDAFEKYYDEDVVMQENEMMPTVGKGLNRQRELKFLDDVQEFRKAAVKGIGVGDNISFVIWEYDYTHKEWGKRSYSQVSVQQWSKGKIVKEQFIYSN